MELSPGGCRLRVASVNILATNTRGMKVSDVQGPEEQQGSKGKESGGWLWAEGRPEQQMLRVAAR